jgi:anti-sigma B factor antagonist
MLSTDLNTRSYDGYAVVALRGELDVADAAVVAAELTAVAAREPGIIVVDLAGLEFIDSSGVAALARGRRQARQAGGELILAAPQPNVTRVLAVIHLAEAFSVYATVREAAREAGHFRERASPTSQRPRKTRWPRAVMWSRTRGLRTLPDSGTLPQCTASAGSCRPSSPDPRATGGIMRALPGDRLLVKERRAGEGDREAVIIEVWSEHGRPPYVVRWHDGSQSVFFPSSADTLIAGDLSS